MSGTPGDANDEPLDDGYGRSAPLAVHVQRMIRFAERHGPLPAWDQILFGERGFGPRALPWDGRFRPMEEFEPRWEQILTATTRDWVHLDLAGVKEGRLLFVVEYRTDDQRRERTWSNEMLSINGSVGGYARDPLILDARW
ncbi:MAG: hypothetical protein ACHP7P_14205 [Terriglobales bacterium]